MDTLPNPTTPLALLPPSVANMIEISRYAYIFALGAFCWDLFSNLNEDYKIVTQFKITPPTIVYFLSRISTLGFVIFSTIFQAAAVDDCTVILHTLSAFVTVAIPTTSLLFFFRIRAVFNGQNWVVGFFGLLWLGVVGACITIPFAPTGGHIGPTRYCMNTAVKSFASIPFTINTINDTLVFLAISFRLAHRQSANSGTSTWKIMTGRARKEVPFVTNALISGGMIYYLITIAGNILTTVLLVTPNISPVLKAVCSVPNVALENAMASRVFRTLKLDLNRHANQGMTNPSVSLPVHVTPHRNHPSQPTTIDVRKTVETFSDPIEMDMKNGWRTRSNSGEL